MIWDAFKIAREYQPNPQHIIAAFVLLAAGVVILRILLIWWHNVVLARVLGTHDITRSDSFKPQKYEIIAAIRARPKGHYFIGKTPSGKPVYLSEKDLDTHGHIMGQTGSGKTSSVLMPLMLQDMLAGKGLIFMDAKGSSENIMAMKSLAALALRQEKVHIFAPAHPSLSDTYNPVYLEPSSDPDAVAERVFSVFEMDNAYYKGQSWLLFRTLTRLLASTGKPFHLNDMRACIGNREILDEACKMSSDKRAAFELQKQLHQLGKRSMETFTGLYSAMANYEHDLLNTYEPTIQLEKIVNSRGLVYFNLPANKFPILAPNIGRIVLQHLQALGAERQINREQLDQTPFAVNVDELNRFAFPNLIPALAMLRDARMQFRLAHQSYGDLEQVSDIFGQQVTDNTRWKLFLFENDPNLLEKVSKAYGTRRSTKRTVRYSRGPLLTLLNTGEISHREVDEFVLHPNAIKNLQPRGQGYLMLPEKIHPLNLSVLPTMKVVSKRKNEKKAHQIQGVELHEMQYQEKPTTPLKKTKSARSQK